jgi:hypothetical protein
LEGGIPRRFDVSEGEQQYGSRAARYAEATLRDLLGVRRVSSCDQDVSHVQLFHAAKDIHEHRAVSIGKVGHKGSFGTLFKIVARHG